MMFSSYTPSTVTAPWFAWHPVRLTDRTGAVWLETVDRMIWGRAYHQRYYFRKRDASTDKDSK